MAELGKPISIYRDGNAIPHIFAESRRDAYFALGYAQAQDRLWQMEFLRRLGSGRLAEILGERLIGTDKYIRTLGLPHVAAAVLDNASPAVKEALSAYVAGVNGWLGARTGALPPEFLLLQFEPERWAPTDPLLWSRLMAIRLGRNVGAERVRARVAAALAAKGLPADMINDLWPGAAIDAPTTVVTGIPLPSQRPAKDSGSNGWIVHGDRTATGKPILANDPHLRFGAPVLWYLAHMEAPGFRVTGATVPGVPFTILGHNGAIAWGMTNGGGDVEDLFLEEAAGATLYHAPDGPKSFELRREIIEIKDREAVEITVRNTRHGPVISDMASGQSTEIAALSTPALRGDDRTVEAILAIQDARNWQQFEAAAQNFHTPHTNLFFASTEGDIGIVSAGRIPIRNAGRGFAPVPGRDGAYDWNGFIPAPELPRLHNPSNGQIVNANNRVVGPNYPYSITANWAAPYRAERIIEVLAGQRKHDIAASQSLQGDVVSAAARRLLPLMLKVPVTGPRVRKAVALLSGWNYEMRRDRPEPLLYATWRRQFARLLIADELGGTEAQGFRTLIRRPAVEFLIAVLTEKRRWCDDLTTKPAESCEALLATSLQQALAELAAALGPGMSDWRWGDRHRASFAHPVLTHIPVLSRLTDLSIETDGGDHTVNRGMTAGPGHEVPATHLDGSGYRAVYDLADLENSRYMIATGQSGNFLSPHYGDFLERWRNGDYIKIPGSKIRDSGAHHLRLVPQ